jgi:hypothetical protein
MTEYDILSLHRLPLFFALSMSFYVPGVVGGWGNAIPASCANIRLYSGFCVFMQARCHTQFAKDREKVSVTNDGAKSRGKLRRPQKR